MRKRCNNTSDLFETKAVYPVRRPAVVETMSFDGTLKRAISQALKECPLTREEIAAKMSILLDCPTFSKAMLDAYSSESRTSHTISVIRMKALVKATGAKWLWDVIVEDDGCIVMEGEEARLAELGLLEQQIREMQKRKKDLGKKESVKIKRRRL